MFEWFDQLPETDQLRIGFTLFATWIVCSLCLAAYSRKHSFGWFVGSPPQFVALLLGVVLPPLLLGYLWPWFSLVASLLIVAGFIVWKIFFKRPVSSDATGATFIGNKETRVYHLPDGCDPLKKMDSRKRVALSSHDEAQAQGYKRCNWCFTDGR